MYAWGCGLYMAIISHEITASQVMPFLRETSTTRANGSMVNETTGYRERIRVSAAGKSGHADRRCHASATLPRSSPVKACKPWLASTCSRQER